MVSFGYRDRYHLGRTEAILYIHRPGVFVVKVEVSLPGRFYPDPIDISGFTGRLLGLVPAGLSLRREEEPIISWLKGNLALGVVLAIIVGITLACGGSSVGGDESEGEAPTEQLTLAGEATPGADTPVSAESSTLAPTQQPPDGPLAAAVEGIASWINSDPLTIAELRGKVVLVDFWTYTCINCIRTFPYLKLWHSKYADDGLVILGIHTPEFEFEKDLDNVTQATLDNGILWPVAQDNDYVTWDNYSNRFWPAKYLIDQDGVVRYKHFGEGRYATTERNIRELLAETGVDFSATESELPSDQTLDLKYLNTPTAQITRELYAGHDRGSADRIYGEGGYVAQPKFYGADGSVVDFEAPDDLSPHQIYFNGPWFISPESARHAGESADYMDYITLLYSARSVNAVLTSDTGEPYRVRITMDGEYLTEENRGEDVIIGEDGESYLLVTQPKLYRIVENPSYVQDNTLRMSSNSYDFGLFAFTFGIYREGP